MKDILVFTTTLSLGGITTYVINLVNELVKKYNVTLAYTNDDASKLAEISKYVKTVSFSYPSNMKTLMIMLRHGWFQHALKIKLRNRYHVSPMGSNQRLAYAQALGTKLPSSLLKHYDYVISSAEFYCNDVIVQKIDAPKKIGWIHPDYKALNTDIAFDRRTLDYLDNIVTVSQSTKYSLQEAIPEYKDKVVYIPNLINVERLNELAAIYPVEYEEYKGKKIIVSVCRIDNSSKRLDRVVLIAKKLVERGESFHWFIVGGGDDFELINNLIKESGLSEHISMIGARANPYPYIAYADLFVLTSQYEGKPIVVDEALVLACPVMVTRYASAQEQVENDYGYIISNNDQSIADDFVSNLNWDDIRKKRQNLEENKYFEKIQSEYNFGIREILDNSI